MDKINRAWVIGLFEGEGSIVFNTRGHGVTLSIQMIDEDVIRKFHSLVGMGSVGGPYKKSNTKHQDSWTWRTARAVDVKTLLEDWLPSLGERRQQRVVQALERLKLSEVPEIRTVCRRGHSWVKENIYIAPKTGRRECRECIAFRMEKGGIA